MAGRLYEHFDVVIAGAGSSGVSAALQAAKKGARVCLVEKESAAGGTYVQSGLTVFEKALDYEVLPGLYELCRDAGKMTVLSGQKLQELYYKLLRNDGILLLTGAWVMGAEQEDGFIRELHVLTREGIITVEGDVFIDATGDGDLAFLCSVPYTEGREDDGISMPVQYCFTITGCSDGWEPVRLPVECCRKFNLSDVRLRPGLREDEVCVTLLSLGENKASSAIDRARVDDSLRAAVSPVMELLRGYEPFRNAEIASVGARVVFPEGRHPQGHTILDTHDLITGKQFEDWVVANIKAPLRLTGMENMEEAPQITRYDIPYRALLPVRTKNLLLAGRCISGTHRAHGSFRSLETTMATGCAAGEAAVLALKENGKVRKVSVEELQKAMMENGMKPPVWTES